MDDSMGLFIQIAFVLFMIGLGFFVGGHLERRHFKDLDEREATNGNFLITDLRTYPAAVAGPVPPTMFAAEAAISSDYFKTFLGTIRDLFGGELKSYKSLLDRARREALQRVVEQAKEQGYNALCNVRFDSCDISGVTKAKKGMVMATIIASGTAYHCRHSSEVA